MVSKLTISVLLSSVLALGATTSCSHRAAPGPPAQGDAPKAPAADLLAAIARAEDRRRPKEIPPEAQSNTNPRVRRAAARAFARVLDLDDAPLLRALEDEDDETVSWAAYGLGESCNGREAAHVRALGSRLVSLPLAMSRSIASILRAIGRCECDQAEPTLRAWLHSGGSAGEAAAYALGELAASTGSLAPDSVGVLLDAAQASPPLAAALYAFGRADIGVSGNLRPRLLEAIRATLGRASPERIFAVRALGRSGDAQVPEMLSRVLLSDEYTAPERIEAAHALARFPKAGRVELFDAIAALAPDGPTLAKELVSDRLGVILAVLGAMGDDPPKTSEATLWTVARLDPGSNAARAVQRRASLLRCAAAQKLARGAWDADVLVGCDLGRGETGERARLAALDRGPLVGARRSAWAALAGSSHVTVRELALGAIARHPELADAARAAIATALSASEPGVVATAANFVQSHPERIFQPATHEIDASVAAALRSALAHPWSEDLVQTRVALVDAGLTSGIEEGRAYARAACADANATVRARAAKALAAAGEKDAICPPPEGSMASAPEVAPTESSSVRVVFETDGGTVAVRFDPTFAPVAVTRLVGLARSGFYTGITVHRVVPGFVAQLGDRGGDGFGGSGGLLRCETAPVPFNALDVGMALAGRDTGSSQIFVTLARSPHLDGQYAWLGHAEGDWGALVEGDTVRDVRIDP